MIPLFAELSPATMIILGIVAVLIFSRRLPEQGSRSNRQVKTLQKSRQAAILAGVRGMGEGGQDD